MHSRRLTFAVGTSLLTASLATAGCSKNHTVNVKPPEEPHVNEGPTESPDAEAPDAEAPDAEAPDAESPDADAPEGDGPPPEDQPNVNVHPSKRGK
jgi:hypothetical protein